MDRERIVLTLFLVFPLLAVCADKPNAPEKKVSTQAQKLSIIEEITSKSQGAGMFVPPLKCDSDGNVYLLTGVQPSSGILKIGHKGELLATYRASSATDLPIVVTGFFTVGPKDNLYQIAYPADTIQRAIIIFGKDGSYKSGIKLDMPPGAPSWIPYQVAVFSSGDLLVSGLVDDPPNKISHPFAGIFSSSGQFRKEISLSEDAKIQKMVEQGDPRVVAPDQPWSNRAVSLGQAMPAEDGNIYLMRNAYPPVFYGISAAGEVVRHFKVDVDGRVLSAHISGQRLALVSQNSGAGARTITVSVVDLEGKPIATYEDDPKEARTHLGSALACYTDNPERFTFLGTTDDGYLQFKIAEAR